MSWLTEEQIDKAASWWADRVCSPRFDGLSDRERQDPANRSYQMAEIMAAMMTERVDDDKREAFIQALSDELRSDDYNPWVGLHVDYHPGPELARAASAAGISHHNFPWKTGLSFYEDGTVKAACGYGQPCEEL